MTVAHDTSPPDYVIFLVHSVSHAMKAERALTKADVPHKLVPVPRTLSSQCGVCIRVTPADREAAEGALGAAGIEIVAVHDLNKEPVDDQSAVEQSD